MEEQALNPNEVVAHNLAQLRQRQGLSLDDVASLVNRYLSSELRRWTKHTVFEAEGGRGKPRKLSPAELAAVSRAFHISLVSLLLPEEGEMVRLGTSSLTREDYGWLVFQLPPESLSRRLLDVEMAGAQHERFLSEIFQSTGNPALDERDIDEIMDSPRIRAWIGSPITETALRAYLRDQFSTKEVERAKKEIEG